MKNEISETPGFDLDGLPVRNRTLALAIFSASVFEPQVRRSLGFIIG